MIKLTWELFLSASLGKPGLWLMSAGGRWMRELAKDTIGSDAGRPIPGGPLRFMGIPALDICIWAAYMKGSHVGICNTIGLSTALLGYRGVTCPSNELKHNIFNAL